jgi:hypothetical protein
MSVAEPRRHLVDILSAARHRRRANLQSESGSETASVDLRSSGIPRSEPVEDELLGERRWRGPTQVRYTKYLAFSRVLKIFETE